MNRIKSSLVQWIGILIFLFVVAPAFSQAMPAAKAKAPDKAAEIKAEEGLRETSPIVTTNTFLARYKPVAHVSLIPSVPLGYVATAFPFGFGANLGVHVLLPYDFMKFVPIIDWHMGVNGGFLGYGASNPEFDAFISLIPMTLDVRSIFNIPGLIKYNLFPYASMGTGMTVAKGSRTDKATSVSYSASSVDYTFTLGGGISWDLPAVPALEVFLDLQYLLSVESRIGNFFNIAIGASYGFSGRIK